MPSGQEVKVDMKNRLSGTGIIIRDNPEAAFGNSLFTGDSRCHRIDVPDQLIVGRIEVECVHKMFSRNEQKMERRDRRDILYDDNPLILKNLFCGERTGYYPAKQTTFIHQRLLLTPLLSDFIECSPLNPFPQVDEKFPVTLRPENGRFSLSFHLESQTFSQSAD